MQLKDGNHPDLGQEMCKMTLGHLVIPDGKEAIRDYWSQVRDSGANLKDQTMAKPVKICAT